MKTYTQHTSPSDWTLDAELLKADAAADSPAPARASLPMLMRSLGAAALAVAMYTFLMHGWQQGSDLSRYLMMLAHTLTLATAGLLCSRWLGESQGARLLVVMALLSVPANFAILGGFVYSQSTAAWLGQVPHWPSHATWTLASRPLALGLSATALCLLGALSRFGFAVLSRSIALPMTALFMVGNAALLLPLRDTTAVSVIACTLMALQWTFFHRRFRHAVSGRTVEGAIALGLLFLPVTVLLGRSLYLYQVSFAIALIAGVASFLLLRRITLALPENPYAGALLNLLSALMALSVTLLGFASLANSPSTLIAVPLAMLGSAAMLYELSTRSPRAGILYRSLALLMSAGYFIGQMTLGDQSWSAALCLLAGIIGTLGGYRLQQRSLFVSSAVMMAAGLMYSLMGIYQHFNLGGWVTLAMAGVALIVGASWLEARGGNLKLQLQQWHSGYRNWQY